MTAKYKSFNRFTKPRRPRAADTNGEKCYRRGMETQSDHRATILHSALAMAGQVDCLHLFLFLETESDFSWFAASEFRNERRIKLVVPRDRAEPAEAECRGCGGLIRNWAGNQSRFSRIKYAFLQGVLQGAISADDRVICVLGPSGRSHLDTVTLHDLALSWSEEFPFDVRPLIDSGCIDTIMAVIDIALDLGALGREGKPIGTIFVIGDSPAVLADSHQAVFNPFKGYDRSERGINRAEVAESLKEFAHLDGAIVIGADGIVEAAGRHLDSGGESQTGRGLGARHRAAAGITVATGAVAVVVSESTGKVTIFRAGRTIATLEPLISRRVV